MVSTLRLKIFFWWMEHEKYDFNRPCFHLYETIAEITLLKLVFFLVVEGRTSGVNITSSGLCHFQYAEDTRDHDRC